MELLSPLRGQGDYNESSWVSSVEASVFQKAPCRGKMSSVLNPHAPGGYDPHLRPVWSLGLRAGFGSSGRVTLRAKHTQQPPGMDGAAAKDLEGMSRVAKIEDNPAESRTNFLVFWASLHS